VSTVVKVENLGKQYRLGQVGTGTVYQDLNRFWYKLRGKEDPYVKIGQENSLRNSGGNHLVWALKEINFDVKEGQVLGIIGKNGAGKSTLLKLLSKVTYPTLGEIKIKGRIAALLEVGTGFHPELTGRENIFLNGAILGMRKAEIRAKFDEIVEFSGVEKYIDTPVKRYSSGMRVRLAFAVAAHLEPEILILDEVLAVGDAEFQKKCLGKMKDVAGTGRTVLFVSHNMAAVKSLCDTALVLVNGKVQYVGETTNAVSYYLKGDSDNQNMKTFSSEYDKPEFSLHQMSLNNYSKTNEEPLVENEDIEFHISLTLKNENFKNYHITFHLINELGETLFSFSPSSTGINLRTGLNNLICTFPKLFFQSGTYYLSLYIFRNKKEAVIIEKDVMSFTVVDGGRELGVFMGREPGFIRPKFNWENKNM